MSPETAGRGIVAAGIDVGNSTTEIVLGLLTPLGVRLIGAGRAPTRRAKGSTASLDGAVALVRRLERQHDVRVERAAAAPLRPVHTGTAALPESRPGTGRLRVVAVGSGTAGGSGAAVGRPHLLVPGSAPDGADPLVAVVPAGTGFRAAVDLLQPLARAGRLAAVVLADDEAVLVANRLPTAVPVVDEVDVPAALAAELLVVEVAADGRPLRSLADPLRLSRLLALDPAELGDAVALADGLSDATNAVVALGTPGEPEAAGAAGWLDLGAGRQEFASGLAALRAGPVGLVSSYALPPELTVHDVDDLWAVDLADVSTQVLARRSTVGRPVTVASLRGDTPCADPSAALAERLGVAVLVAGSEAEAARAGALTTPGATPDAVVVDLGGGTVDTVSAGAAVVAAGGGELLTLSVAGLAGVTAAAAEHVKRGPAHRVEAPQVLLAEDGTRTFLDRPTPREAVGSLVVSGPAGWLPFHRTLAPGEWRALRLRLKVELLGVNVARALRTLDVAPRTVVVVGGPAGDDEVLAAVTGALPAGTAVGRGDAAGVLGHRYCVAWGLLTGLAG